MCNLVLGMGETGLGKAGQELDNTAGKQSPPFFPHANLASLNIFNKSPDCYSIISPITELYPL